tara:strand:- start:510 stop:2246 length:1737 start_codon:yes stop_codon:yes gene_type:complete
MAENIVAITMLVLGSAYLYSNQDDDNNEKKEDFTNYKNSSVNALDGPFKNCRDKFFTKESTALGNAESNIQADASFNPSNAKFTSLSGVVINSNDVAHNNMTPYYSGTITGSNDINNNIVLENYNGSSSHVNKKEEVGTFFSPEENMQNVYGNQNANDFLQSRVNAGLSRNNVNPFKEANVAPGINKGYTSDGTSIGFNSGMEERDLWKPKTVDELRAENNPKMSYSLDGHMGPALDKNQDNRGHLGKTIKKSQDTYYENTPDKWLTTTSDVKGNRNRSEILLNDNNRHETTKEYYGVRGSSQVSTNYVKSDNNNNEKEKNILPSKPFINLTATNSTPIDDIGYGKNSFYAYSNNRTVNDNEGIFGNAYGNVYANVIEPIYNGLRHTRKTNVVGNIRESGNVGVLTKGEKVYNPNDKPYLTNREMDITKLDFNHLNVQRQKDGGYVSNEYQPVENQRATTNYSDFGVVSGSQGQGEKLYNSAYQQTSKNNKNTIERTNLGNMSLFNPYVNVNLKESSKENTRTNAIYDPNTYAPNQQLLGENEKYPQNYSNNNEERMDTSLLNAFKNNPYTQPLNSVA